MQALSRPLYPVRFLVLPRSVGRCGSTWFCDLINSHRYVECLNELFNPGWAETYSQVLEHLDGSRDPQRVYHEIQSFRPGRTHYGFKTFESQVEPHELEAILRYVDRVLLLDRDNLMQAHASQLHAEATDTWIFKDGDAKPEADGTAIEVDIGEASLALMRARKRADQLTQRVAATGTPYKLFTYEGLVEDTQAVLDDVFDFLAIERRPVKSEFKKVPRKKDFFSNKEEINTVLGDVFGRL